MNYDQAPNWLKAADAHTVGANNTSVFEDIATSIGNTPKAAVVSIASGLNSIYNSGIAVANVFTDDKNDMEYSDTGELITALDDDLGKYYATDPEFFDLAGFVATSFIPGLGAVKALTTVQKAAQLALGAGKFGANMSRATKLLAPATRTYVERNAADLASRSATFSFRNANAVKALAANTQQGILEGLAFETAVAATMFKSPVLDDMDTSDMIRNLALGAGIGGAFGAIGGIAKTYFGTKKLLRNAEGRQQALATSSTQLELGTNTADKISAALDDKLALGDEITSDQVLALKLARNETGESITPQAVASEVSQLNRLRESNLGRLNNEIRTGVRELTTTKDNVFPNLVADFVQRMDDSQMFDTLLNTRQIVRAADELEFTATVKKAEKAAKKGDITEGELAQIKASHNVSYVQLHSGGIGDVLSEGPASAMRLADKMTGDQIDDFVRKAKFKVTKGEDFTKIKDRNIAEARWIWSRSKGKGAPNISDKTVVDEFDLPLFSRAVADGRDSLYIKRATGELDHLRSAEEIKNTYHRSQMSVVLSQADRGAPTGSIELFSNVRRDFIETNANADRLDIALNAQESYADEVTKFLARREQAPITAADLHYRPKYAKLAHQNSTAVDEHGMVLKGMQQIKYRQKFYEDAAQRATAGYLGKYEQFFPKIKESVLRTVWRGGTGNSIVTNAGGDYGSLESYISRIGQLTGDLKREKMKLIRTDLELVNRGLLTNPEAAVEFSTINNIIANTPEKYVLDVAEDGTAALIPRKVRDYREALEQGNNTTPPPQLAQGTPESIPINTKEAHAAISAHISMTGKRNQEWRPLHTLRGNADRKFDDTFYPVRRDPREFNHVAFVKDDTLVGVGHTRMITAPSSGKLAELISKVPSQYRVLTTNETDDYFKAVGEWKYDKTLHENYLDTDLTSRGIYSDFFPQTDPEQVVNTFVQHHTRSEHAIATDMILARYEKEVQELRRLGAQYSNVPGSGTGPEALKEISRRKNPYESMIKNMLDITEADKTPASHWYISSQRKLDEAVSSVWAKADEILNSSKYSEQSKIDQINDVFDKLGFKSAYYDATLNALANSRIPKGTLTSFVRKVNAFLTTTILRLDPFNALNNGLGNTILLSAETSALVKTIRGNDAAAGELAKLAGIKLVGTEQDIFSPQKLIANAYRRLTVGKEAEDLRKFYDDNGLLPDLADQYYMGLDAASLTGTETAADMAKKSAVISKVWTKLTAKGEAATGNKWVESMNRMVAGDVMKQITDIAVKRGLIDEREALTYINTMINRVNGVIRASERPLMFQGPIGQAIGLFQSYQMNLIQQTLRHIGEGRNKQLALAAGLQSSIYGASSLPGFNLINSNLATASGNSEHYDLYSATQAIFGKEGAEWLMYGMPSNILNMSLYTRGDTNPRVWHIVPNPTNPQDLPAVSAMARLFGSLSGAAKKIGQGAPVWESIVSGVEHSGLSRPLAGLAAVSRGLTSENGKVFSTQRSGNLAFENDLVSLASLGRILGAKPLDEAMQQNAYYRVKAYAAYDRDKRLSIGASIREALTGGNQVSSEQVLNFMEQYVARGGSQENFNQYWMSQYKKANQSQAAKLAADLDSPYGRRMQEIMGGMDSLAYLE